MLNSLKYILIILFFPLSGWGQENHPMSAPKFSQPLSGQVDLSGGIYWPEAHRSPGEQSLADFFRQQGVEIFDRAEGRKSIPLEIHTAESIFGIPEGTFHGYSIRIEPTGITLVCQTAQAEATACRRLMELVHKQGLTRKSGRLRSLVSGGRGFAISGYEVRDWLTDAEMTVCRWTGIDSSIPSNAAAVEMRMVDPAKGWIGAGAALQSVGYSEPLCTGRPSDYAELETERKKLVSSGLIVTPVFDLTEPNPRFEAVTGHPMLSVEGMRFVSLLLDRYLSQTGSQTIVFVVPPGRFREQIRDQASKYPNITDLHFEDE